MKTQIEIFEQGKGLGIFSNNEKFYPLETPLTTRNKHFKETRLRLGERLNLDGHKIFHSTQKSNLNKINYPNGKYIVITNENLKKEDYWDEILECDILLISNKYPNIIVGNQMADCPILIAEDRRKGITALSHCGAAYIDRKLPVDTIKALEQEYNSNLDDIYVYITSHISKDSYIYDKYPKWATNNEIWKNSITKVDEKYSIDLSLAIKEQLILYGVKHIEESNIDTATNDNYYSHYATNHNKKDKLGQNFVGFYYKN